MSKKLDRWDFVDRGARAAWLEPKFTETEAILGIMLDRLTSTANLMAIDAGVPNPLEVDEAIAVIETILGAKGLYRKNNWSEMQGRAQ